MPERDLDLLIGAAEAAGAVAKGFWRKDPKFWEKAPGDPVGEADLAANTVLRERLCAARPDYGWMSEEDEDTPERRASDKVFIVDPIDGTKSFLKGEENWGVAAAVVEKGVVTAGVFVMPAKRVTYAAALGEGVTKNGVPIAIRPPAAIPDVLTAKASFRSEHWSGSVPEMERAFRPSLVYRFALVAEGRFDMTLTLRGAWEWDIAAGAILVSEAGGKAVDRYGAALVFNSLERRVDGAVAASVDLVDATVARLSGA